MNAPLQRGGRASLVHRPLAAWSSIRPEDAQQSHTLPFSPARLPLAVPAWPHGGSPAPPGTAGWRHPCTRHSLGRRLLRHASAGHEGFPPAPPWPQSAAGSSPPHWHGSGLREAPSAASAPPGVGARPGWPGQSHCARSPAQHTKLWSAVLPRYQLKIRHIDALHHAATQGHIP